MKAILIGGGIGGLSAALALERVGIRCDVFEQADGLREVGAGLTVWSNAIRALEQVHYPRTAAITNDSWRLGRLCQWENPLGCWVRNRLTSWTPNTVSLRLMETRVNHVLPTLQGPGRA